MNRSRSKEEAAFLYALRGHHAIARRWRVRWLRCHLPKARPQERANRCLVDFLRSACLGKDHESLGHCYYFTRVRRRNDPRGWLRYRILGVRIDEGCSTREGRARRWMTSRLGQARRWLARCGEYGKLGISSSAVASGWIRPLLRVERTVRRLGRRRVSPRRMVRPSILAAWIEKRSALRREYRRAVAVEGNAAENFRTMRRLAPQYREQALADLQRQWGWAYGIFGRWIRLHQEILGEKTMIPPSRKTAGMAGNGAALIHDAIARGIERRWRIDRWIGRLPPPRRVFLPTASSRRDGTRHGMIRPPRRLMEFPSLHL